MQAPQDPPHGEGDNGAAQARLTIPNERLQSVVLTLGVRLTIMKLNLLPGVIRPLASLATRLRFT